MLCQPVTDSVFSSLAARYIASAFSCAKKDFICNNDRQDWISADDRDKDDAFNIVVLVNGNVGVTVFFHNIQTSPN